MKTNTETQGRELNVVIALLVIREDKFLSDVFSKNVGDNFPLYITQAEKGIFASVPLIEEIFNDIICQSETYSERYDYLMNSKTLAKMVSNVVEEKNPTDSIKFKGQILEDAKKNGETDRHRALLKLNDLKNLQRRLRNICDKDYLTDDEYRILRASIMTLETKVKPLEDKKYKKNR